MSDVTLVFIWGIGLGMAITILLLVLASACVSLYAWIRIKIFQMQVRHVTKRVDRLSKEIQELYHE